MSKKKDEMHQYLNDEELQILDDINEIQENIHKHKKETKKLENMSLKNLFGLWIKTNVDILNDISKINYKSYEKYFEDIDNTKYWWNGILTFIKFLFGILTKGNRIIFMGINLIIVSILIYFISSTS